MYREGEKKNKLRIFCEFSRIGRSMAIVPFFLGWASHDMTKWERWNECSLCYLLYAPFGEICDSTYVRSMRCSFVTYSIVQTWTSKAFLCLFLESSRDPEYVPLDHKNVSMSPMSTQLTTQPSIWAFGLYWGDSYLFWQVYSLFSYVNPQKFTEKVRSRTTL
jgi:hypothetical protein